VFIYLPYPYSLTSRLYLGASSWGLLPKNQTKNNLIVCNSQ